MGHLEKIQISQWSSCSFSVQVIVETYILDTENRDKEGNSKQHIWMAILISPHNFPRTPIQPYTVIGSLSSNLPVKNLQTKGGM